MKNSDMPAMPLSGDAYTDFAHYDETKNTSYNPECQGLTKREHFAGLAMQGILSSLESKVEMEALATVAVQMADALLTELEK